MIYEFSLVVVGVSGWLLNELRHQMRGLRKRE